MNSRLTNVIRTNGIKHSIAFLAKRALQRTGQGLLQVADKLPANPKLSSLDRKLLDTNKAFKNKHAGQRAFVIGTGPSLQTQDLSPLGNEITFSLSGFWKHPVIETWQPTYYCFSDPLLFDGSETMNEFFRSIRQHVSKSTFFVPLSARPMIEREDLLPVKQTQYVAFQGDLSESAVADVDFCTFVPGIMNVAQFCILLAIYMGLSPIYLLGLDHDWLSHQGETKHFYQGQAGLEKHPEVRPILADWSYRHLMECQLVGWKAYEHLLQLAQRKQIQIFNATNGGFLDVFERVDYRELVPESSR